MNFQSQFIQQLKNSFRGLKDQALENRVSENLISPFTLHLPASVLKDVQKSIEVLFRLRENKTYQSSYHAELSALNLMDPGNKSICMSYDFHVTADQQIKLIEVNTNASFLALGHEMYKLHGLPLPVKDFSLEEIRRDIETEVRLHGKDIHKPMNVAIIDEEPEQQRLFIEFLVYQELFKEWGWNSQIQDYRSVDLEKTDFIYNRYTDFLFQQPESAALKSAFISKSTCFSPHPYEYFLLADKQRMIDWSLNENLQKWRVSPEDQAVIQSVVPRSFSLEAENKEDIWAQRKTLFLKPKRAFGSKQSYRGSSISRKIFDELVGQEIIAQSFVPPSEQVFQTPEGEQSFKYDLRCFAYQGRLQLIVARLYQGQVTNLRTPWGGFACVEVRPSF